MLIEIENHSANNASYADAVKVIWHSFWHHNLWQKPLVDRDSTHAAAYLRRKKSTHSPNRSYKPPLVGKTSFHCILQTH